jgi:hypothetical protein
MDLGLIHQLHRLCSECITGKDTRFILGVSKAKNLGSKFQRNSGSGPFSGIFGPGVTGIIF